MVENVPKPGSTGATIAVLDSRPSLEIEVTYVANTPLHYMKSATLVLVAVVLLAADMRLSGTSFTL